MGGLRFIPAVLVAILGVPSSAPAAPGDTVRVSVSASGEQGNGLTYGAAVSGDGQVAAFYSYASNLVPGDTNGAPDVFVRDLTTGAVERVSVSSSEEQADARSEDWLPRPPAISHDGRYVAFTSRARNLIPVDANEGDDIFVRDRLTGTTILASVTAGGVQPQILGAAQPSISADGRYVAFFAAGLLGEVNSTIYLKDLSTGSLEQIDVSSEEQAADLSGYSPSVSADGRFVAFESSATNLVPGDTLKCSFLRSSNLITVENCRDIFVRDRVAGTTVRISVSSAGAQANGHSLGPVISGDGRLVVFHSDASNLVPDDTNELRDVFVHDLVSGETTRASVGSDGSQGLLESTYPSISADGRWVAFNSGAPNLVEGDVNGVGDVFVHDLLSGVTSLVSRSTYGIQGDLNSFDPRLSADGSVIAFTSYAETLVAGDTNLEADAFVRSIAALLPTCVGGATEDGRVTGVVHERIEQLVAIEPLHDVNCALATLGL